MGHTLTLPSGWKKARLGELFAERNETNKVDLELLSITGTRGIIPRSELEGKDNSNCDKSKYLKVCVGDIAYNTMRMWQGVSALSSYEGIVSPAYTVLVPLKEAFAPYFSYLFKLRAMINIFYRNSQGLVDDQRSLKYHNFARIKVTIPPLPEQKRIAEILIEQDKLIALKERLIAAKKKQKKWLMQNLLTGKIRLEGFSEEWQEKFLEDIATVNMGQSPNSQNYNTEGIGLPLIQGNADIDNRRTIAKTFTSQTTRKANLGDIIMSVRAPVGKVAVATFECCIGRGVCAICGSEYVKQLLLYYECNWSRLSQGSTFDSVNGKEIRQLKFKIPLSNEQTAIAERLTAADLEIELLTKELEAQKQIKKYLMQQLLTGKIRVTGGDL